MICSIATQSNSVKDAMQLRRTILEAQLHLTNCPHSRALSGVHDAILSALPIVVGRPLELHRSDLGVLPLEGIPPLRR
jgi:hypothetical protein